MTSHPFGLTDEDLRSLGMFMPSDAVPVSVPMFRGVPIKASKILDRHYIYCEVDGRLYLGEGSTEREAFLAMARHQGTPIDASGEFALTPLALRTHWKELEEFYGARPPRYMHPLADQTEL